MAYPWSAAKPTRRTTAIELFINIALTGEVEKGRAILRSGAQGWRRGVCVGGVGGSLAGHHLKFEPRLKESSWLAAEFEVHSMIDVSDGLAGDLRHIARASGVGAELLETAVPISRSAKRRARDQDFEQTTAVGGTDGW